MNESLFVLEILPPDPEALMAILPQEGLLFLDSSNTKSVQGRYSFLGFAPQKILRCQQGQLWCNDVVVEGTIFDYLQKEYRSFTFTGRQDLPPFQGGWAGMLGYESARYLEKLPQAKQDDIQCPDAIMGYYDCLYAWDHHRQKAWIIAHAPHRLHEAQEYLSKAKSLEQAHQLALDEKDIQSTFTAMDYKKTVEKVIEYIRAGDIFEANLSQRFSATLPEGVTPFDIYRQLRKTNPAPFSAYFHCGNTIIASASPERFLRLSQNKVETRPIKGTIVRDICPNKDFANGQTLLESEKDRAENIMIVDLMRNDLSRVCLPHSVKVPQLCGLETFATVHHLVSAVEGTLMPDKDPIDLIKATFPGGSITGAPKIRAMEIIAELEPTVRGPYCGSMGYIGGNGEMDLSITIRTFVIVNDEITFHAGGAITVDSSPEAEYDETLTKAAALKRTLLKESHYGERHSA